MSNTAVSTRARVVSALQSIGNDGDDVLNGSSSADTLDGGLGNDTLDGKAGADKLIGGAGDDTYYVDNSGDVVTELADQGNDSVITTLASYVLGANVENLQYAGAGAFTATGNALANSIVGSVGAGNKLDGGAGDDTVVGGVAADSLLGGLGDDGFFATWGKDTIDGGAGSDTLVAFSTRLSDFSVFRASATDTVLTYRGDGMGAGTVYTLRNVESFVFLDGMFSLSDVQANSASPGNDSLAGSSGNDTLDGAAGADTLAGWLGDDTYVVDNVGDVVTEGEDEGTDTVRVAFAAAATYTLGANVENASVTSAASVAVNLAGNALDNKLAGNAAANTLSGGAGNDTLDGGAGADKLSGGAGNDTYVVDAAGDVVTEIDGEGSDLVQTSLATYTLGANVEDLVYTGAALFTGTGNALGNTITAGSGGSKIDGGAGNDTLHGGSGADNLLGGLGNDELDVAAGGKDTVDGGAGADTVSGLGAFETYTVTRPNATDTVLTDKGGNVVTVRNVEALVFDGQLMTLEDVQDNVASLGNDSLDGTVGNDTLNGGAGADTLAGSKGDDTYVIDNLGDVVVEAANEGVDSLQVGLAAAGTYALADNVENATVTAAATVAVNLAGNALNNKLVGNAAANTLLGGVGNDTLDGGAGADKLTGGAGNDTYIVDVAGDVVTEAAGEGTDGVETALATYVLGANIENLKYTGAAAFTGTGNALGNALIGGAAGNKLDGGAGDDTIAGGAGADSLVGGAGDDVFVFKGGGKDTIDGGDGNDALASLDNFSLYTITRPSATETLLTHATKGSILVRNVESFEFADVTKSLAEIRDNTASGANDSITGTDSGDVLNGGLGADTMAGGKGDDSYTVDNPLDVVVEDADAGFDTVFIAAAAAGTFTIAANVEQVDATGSAALAINITGNALDNTIYGNAGANSIAGGGGSDTLIGGAGADKLSGGTGDDVLYVQDSTDVLTEAVGEGSDTAVVSIASYTLAANVENFLATDSLFISGVGNALNNKMTAGLAGAKLDGGVGNDSLAGGNGNDSLLGGAGDDSFETHKGKDTIDGGDGSDTLTVDGKFASYTVTRPTATDTVLTDGAGNVYTVRGVENFVFGDGGKTLSEVQNNIASIGNDSITGTPGADTLNGGAGVDTLVGGDGNDTYVVDVAGDVITENADQGTDLVQVALAAAGTYVLGANVENGTVTSAAAIAANIAGNALANKLVGNAAANALLGGGGNDTLDGGAGADKLTGGTGDDTYLVDVAGDAVTEAVGEGYDTVKTALATYTLGANVEELVYTGTVAFTGTGNAGDNNIVGGNGGNKIDGGAGNDDITGGAGADSLLGGLGNDAFVAGGGKDTIDGGDGSGDVLVDLGAFGSYAITRPSATDTVLTDKGGNVITVRNVEHFEFSDGSKTLAEVQDNIVSPGNDNLHGDVGNDTLDGGAGADTLAGREGDDTYVVDVTGDVVTELADGGADLVQVAFTAAGTYVLGANVENGTVTAAAGIAANVTGNALDNKLVGNAAANTLLGGAGNDTLDGGAGADKLSGGLGDDLYVVDAAGDAVTEAAGEGTDTVQTTLATYVLAANVEALAYKGAALFTGTGNAGDNSITGGNGGNKLDGGAGDDKLAGGTGADSLVGGLGSDTLVATSGKDTVDGGDGIDVLDGLNTFDSYTITRPTATDTVLTDKAGNVLTVRGVEVFVFDGVPTLLAEVQDNIASPGNDNLHGDVGNDTLNGGLGADTMAGDLGDDTYVADNVGDLAVEDVDAGHDLVQVALAAAGTYVLGANVEDGTVTAAAAIAVNLAGNALDNKLVGNAAANTLLGGAGNDTLDGGAGADKLAGGLGDDTYVVDLATDTVTEAADEGVDTVKTTLATYALAANVEELLYTGSGAFAGTGNAQDNLLDGGNGGSKLDGGAGSDTLQGGAGADSLVGGLGNDVLVNSGGKDTLDGGAGNDVLTELDFRDEYTVTRPNATDVVLTYSSGQVLTVRNVEDFGFADGHLPFADVVANIASLGNDNLHGTGLADTLDGGLGNDTMAGLEGNDVYVVDNPADLILEEESAGVDTVRVAFTAAGTYTMADNLDNALVTAAATVAVNVTGNNLDNVITGNAAANTLLGGDGDDRLNGGAGADKLVGGDGDDLYVVDNAADVVTELADEGMDALETTLTSYVLPANVEFLAYSGPNTTAFNGTGNALGNDISGSRAGGKLDGGAGNDTLWGYEGADSLVGGLGDDRLVAGGGKDTLDGGDGFDTAVVVGDVKDYTVTRPNAIDTVLTGKDGNVLTLRGIEEVAFGSGDGDTLPITAIQHNIRSDGNDVLVGDSGANTIDGGLGADTMEGGGGDDTYVLDNVGDTVIEDAMGGTDLVLVTKVGAYTLADFVENGTITSAATGVISLDGNNGDNLLTGNALANKLSGGAGSDTLVGGAGADTMAGGEGDDLYYVDAAGDVVAEQEFEGTDTVITTAASYVLGAEVENLRFAGASGTFTGTGNALDNVIQAGNTGSKLDGGIGNDTLLGGSGNDSLVGGISDDFLSAGSGKDTVDGGAGDDVDMIHLGGKLLDYTIVRSNAVDWVFSDAAGNVTTVRNVEQFEFADRTITVDELQESVGGSDADELFGTPGNDKLDGGLGNDTMSGGVGDDTYVLSAAGDVVHEEVDAGKDTVLLNFTAAAVYVMADEVEKAVVTAPATVAVSVTGNDGDNEIVGNGAANTLRGGQGDDSLVGGGGNDSLFGGGGNDSYDVGEAGDVVTELADEGFDTVYVHGPASYTLGANVENLFYTGALAFAGNGNALDNQLVTSGVANVKFDGGAGDDLLVGGFGDDSLQGGLGDDTFQVDAGGIDTVDGGAGDDLLMLGNDAGLFTVVRLNDTDVMLALVNFAQETSVVVRNVEHFSFIDGSIRTLEELTSGIPGPGADTLTGGAGTDYLNGGPGADSMIGGDGEDVYFVDNAGDVLVEQPEGGVDRAYISLASGSYTLPTYVEWGQLLGHAATSLVGSVISNWLVGNDAANKLSGLTGNDTLDGAGGADTLVGGVGNDTYVVSTASTVVTEAAGEGFDAVQITELSSYTLPANVEALQYKGYGAFSGTGNALNNHLVAFDASSAVLDGAAGNDTIQGGDGDDSVLGGLGDDELYAGMAGTDVLDGGAGADRAMLAALGEYDIQQAGADLLFTRLSDDSVITVRNVENFDFDGDTFTLAELIAVINPPI